MRQHPEDDLQRCVAEFLERAHFLFCHVPNGGKRNAREAARFKAMGVKAGVPDILIFTPPKLPTAWPGSLHGIAIELKAPKGQTSQAQEAWLRDLDSAGWWCFVCRSLDEVLAALRSCGWWR